MKKQILAFAMLSTITLTTISQAAVAVKADDYDTKISQKNKEIDNLKSKETSAQAEVDKVQAQVDATMAKASSLSEETAKLEKKSKELSKEVDELNDRIIKRRGTIEKQARSVQTSGTGTNILDVILDADSITDAITRVQAVTKIVSANNELLKQQKDDKKAVQVKQKDNADKIKTVWNNTKQLKKEQASLKAQQTELKAAKLGLEASRATAEGDRDKLLKQQADAKAEAERLAKQAAEEQAAREKAEAEAAQAAAQQEQEEASRIPETNEPADNGSNGGTTGPSTPTPTPSRPSGGRYSSVNRYPVGQCTWYVKSVFGSRCGDVWGNGGQWAASAAADGLTVSSTPAAGTIAVFPPGVAGAGGYGHVAVVNSVSGGRVTITECNFGGPGRMNTRTIPAAGLMFIYC